MSQKLPIHRDQDSFPGLVHRLDVEAILVVIASFMGQRIGQRMAPEDIWQETLFMAWRDRDQHEWRDLRHYRGWLLVIAKNRVRDAALAMSTLKRGGDRETRVLSCLGAGPDDDSEFLAALPRDSVTPSRLATQRERAQAMMDALAKLPAEYQDPVRLRLFEQLQLTEVAEQLGIALATAKKRVYLGSQLYRTQLRRVLSRVPGEQSS